MPTAKMLATNPTSGPPPATKSDVEYDERLDPERVVVLNRK